MTVPSPCTDVCKMHLASGWCEGCGRTLDEIAAWGQLDEGARWRLWKLLPARRAELQRRAVHPPEPPAA